MNCALDSSILVAALDSTAEFHSECAALLDLESVSINTHALAETFNTLTGGKLGFRLTPRQASGLLRNSILPAVRAITLSAEAVLEATDDAESRGVRGAAIYDYLHLTAARSASAARLYTLDISHFLAFHHPGDPEIAHP